jgi:hypothetical protein
MAPLPQTVCLLQQERSQLSQTHLHYNMQAAVGLARHHGAYPAWASLA